MAEQMDFAKWNAELAKNNQKLSEVKEEIVKSNEKAEEELDYAKLRDERSKKRGIEQKQAEGRMIKSLEDSGFKNEDFQDTVVADMKKGITYSEQELKTMSEYYDDVERRDKRDAKEKRQKEKKEEERQASNLRAEESLGKMLGIMGLQQETAERMAKKAMQMKESVHKWWEDKKEKVAAGAKSILEWLLKAAGLAALWALFKLLAKTDWEQLYNDTKLWVDLIWTGLTRFFAFKGLKSLIGWMKNTKVAKLLGATFRSIINVMKLVIGSLGRAINKGPIKAITDWFTGKTRGSLPRKIMAIWKNTVRNFNKQIKIGKAWVKGITGFFGEAKGSLGQKIKNMWKAITGPVMKALDPAIKALKGALKPLLDFFKTGKGATGAGGIFTKITNIMKSVMPITTKAMGFVGTILKTFGKLFAPITVFMAAWAAISGGLDEAEKESGGFPQKILSFISGALKGLIDFFVFDLANLIQDGIKWAIGWFMGLFGFSEEEIEKATDFDFVKPIKDAVFGAIDWVRDLFRFDGKGISFKGLAPLIDILLWPLNKAMDWLNSIFKFSTDETGEAKKFSIGDLITGALDSIIGFFTDILDFDFTGMLKSIPGYDLISGFFTDSKEDIQEEIDELKKSNETYKGKDAGSRRKRNIQKIAQLEAQLEKMATGGTILPGGAAIVGEGSMAGELVLNANSAAKVIPAKQSADLMSGIGGGQNFAPTTIVNSAPASTTMIASSSSLNPVSQKYFRSD